MSGSGLHWHAEPWAVLPMTATLVIYGIGLHRLWRRAGAGRGIGYGSAAHFVAGWTVACAALFSPLAELAEQLFAAHMVVHELLMTVAAPLLVLSRPYPAFAWAVPAAASVLASGGAWLKQVFVFLCRPAIATVLHGLAIWVWHMPALFALTAGSELIHGLQHASFFGSGLLFWSAMLKPSRTGAGAGVFWLFATSMHTNFLGALLVLSPRLWYPVRGGYRLSALEDQQLGGLIMWVPGGLVYASAALLAAGTWIARSGAQSFTRKSRDS
jgi:putative membrane protein